MLRLSFHLVDQEPTEDGAKGFKEFAIKSFDFEVDSEHIHIKSEGSKAHLFAD